MTWNLLMNHLSGEDMKWKMIVTLAITTGMRRGEIAGLEWDLSPDNYESQQTFGSFRALVFPF